MASDDRLLAVIDGLRISCHPDRRGLCRCFPCRLPFSRLRPWHVCSTTAVWYSEPTQSQYGFEVLLNLKKSQFDIIIGSQLYVRMSDCTWPQPVKEKWIFYVAVCEKWWAFVPWDSCCVESKKKKSSSAEWAQQGLNYVIILQILQT